MKKVEPWMTWTPPAHILKRSIAGPDAVRAMLRVQELLRDYVKPEHVEDHDIQQGAGAQFHDFARDQFAKPLPFWERLVGTDRENTADD